MIGKIMIRKIMIGEAWLLDVEPLKVKGFLLFAIF